MRNMALYYVPFNIQTVKLVLMNDESFTNGRGLRSQLGYVLALVDSDINANVVLFSSKRRLCVAGSVMDAEVLELITGFELVFIINYTLKSAVTSNWNLMSTERRYFNVVAKDGSTTERRLKTDIFALCESGEKCELSKIGWIFGAKMSPTY